METEGTGNSEVPQLDDSGEVILNFPETQKDDNSPSSDDEPSSESDLETLSEVSVNSRRERKETRRQCSSKSRETFAVINGALRDLVSELREIKSNQSGLEARLLETERIQLSDKAAAQCDKRDSGDSFRPFIGMQPTESRITEDEIPTGNARSRQLGSSQSRNRPMMSRQEIDPRLSASSQPFVSRAHSNMAVNQNTNYANTSSMTPYLCHNGHTGGQIHQNGCQYGHQPEHYSARSHRSRSHERMRIPPFDGKEDWRVWSTRFDVLSYRFGWSDDTRLDQLLQRLEGHAAEFAFTQLTPATLHNYQELKAELNSRFRVVETAKTFAAKFTRRNQRHGEPAESYAAELKMLYDKAHPKRDRRTREEDLVRRFLDGLLDDDTRFEVEYHKEPATIDEAVYNVVTLVQTRGGTEGEKGYRRSTRRTTESEKPYAGDQVAPKKPSTYSGAKRWPKSPKQDTSNDSGEILQQILKRLDNLEGRAMKSSGEKRSRKDVECYRCHGKGHFARECLSGEKKGEVVHTEPKLGESNLPLNETGPALAAKGRSQ